MIAAKKEIIVIMTGRIHSILVEPLVFAFYTVNLVLPTFQAAISFSSFKYGVM